MNAKILRVGLGLLTLVGMAVAAVAVFPKTVSFRGTLYDPPLPAPEIVLTQGNGSSFRLSEKRGNVVLLFFGFTSCPDVCPTTLSELRRVTSAVGVPSERVQVVFVTVDPERDTPQKLQDYVSIFDPAFIGLGGSMEALEQVWQGYGVYREVTQLSHSDTGYDVTHTARVYLIDQDGNLRLSYSYGTPTDDILHDLKVLLKQ